MKIIRQKTFETNSSSTHSITMCMESEYEKWKSGELYYLESNNSFVTPEEKDNILRRMTLEDKFDYHYGEGKETSTYTYKGVTVNWDDKDLLITEENLAEITNEDIEEYIAENFDEYEMPCSYEQYYENIEYETYKKEFTTPKGEKIVSFGYYGNNY